MYRTGAVVAVLSALDVTQWRYAGQLSAATGLASGTLAKALARLEGAGLAVSRWEEAEEAQDALPGDWPRQRRHYFRLTSAGLAQAIKWGEAHHEK